MPIDNNTFQKNANTSLIANTIWNNKLISRAEIARQLGLYRSTVTNVTTYLLENNVIKEGSLYESTNLGGRRAVELSINPSFGCVFGFDIQPSHYRAVILLADGTEVWRETGSFGSVSIEEMVEGSLKKAFKAHRAIHVPVIALSFSVPGIVSNDYGKIENSFPFYRENVDIRHFVHEHYDYPVFVENDANTAAWLDIWKNNVTENAISIVADYHEEAKTNPDIVGIGTGIGIIVNGKVYRGSHNAAGEFKTISWKQGLHNQSGLPNEVLREVQENKENLKLWMEDTFKSLIPIFSVMDFDKVFFHGNPFVDTSLAKKIVEENVPEFVEVLKNTSCKAIFDSDDECVSARGAAMMCLQELFSIPDLNSIGTEFDSWEKTIAFLKKQCR